MNEMVGGVTIKGNPLTTMGQRRSVGEAAPDVALAPAVGKTVNLSDYRGKTVLLSVVPSLDTGICDAQTRRFNEEAAAFGTDVAILTISAEHPFNQGRWCGNAGIDQASVLSDHMALAFGDAFGLHIKEWRLLQRAIFVLDRNGTITYTEYIPEIAQHPDYDAALAALATAVTS